ncbi:MAG: hypothetical protein ACTMHS_13025 [Micrococcaceae bacterium]
MDTEHDPAPPDHHATRPHHQQVEPASGRPEPPPEPQYEAEHEPEPEPSRPDVETRTPEAIRAAQVARDRDQEPALRAARVRGVEWVRPTDLMARHSALLAGRGIDFQAELARHARRTAAARLHRVGDRVRQLPPLSAFGRSQTTQSGPRRPGVGKS